MHTEAEAKEKICAVRTGVQWKCEGSGCMQWRWQYDRASVLEIQREDVNKKIAEGYQVIGARGGSLGPVLMLARRTEHGYCGLAGRPIANASDL